MLTPDEIAAREFLVSVRGYDRDEVHAFLARVAEQVAASEARADEGERRVQRLRADQVTAPAAPAVTPEAQPAAMFAEIGKETQRILEAAQEAGAQIQRKARHEADRELQAARGQAAKVIAEGERRRERMERTVEALEQARDALSEQLRAVGRTLEQTLRDLAPGRPAASVRDALTAQVRSDATTGRQPAIDAAPPAPEPALETDEVQPAADPAVATDEVQPASDSALVSNEDQPAPRPEPATDAAQPEHEPEPETNAAAPAVEVGAAASAPEPEPAADGAPAPDESPAATPTAPGERPAAPQAATRLSPPAGGRDGARREPQGLRAAALSPLHPKLVRKVKRELQEMQNIALDRVRRAKGKGDADAFLPQPDEAARLGAGAGEYLDQAYRAGGAAAATLAERDLGEPAATPDLAGTFADDAAERVRASLAATLRMGVSASEDASSLADRIGAVFGELKGTSAEELAATHLIRAYELGMLRAWRAGGVTARRWVLGREPRCPEARCRSNDQSGALGLDQPFPSGHDVPPVHVGCTCTTVPVTEPSE